jgi:hypothetical protein
MTFSFLENNDTTWTTEEDEKLKKEIYKFPLFMIAQRHKRSFISIQERIFKITPLQ